MYAGESKIRLIKWAGVKTNLLFFTKGKPTERVWYYDRSEIKVGNRTPFILDRCGMGGVQSAAAD